MRTLFVIFIFLSCTSLLGQDPSFSLSSENLNYLNPAFTGTSQNMKFGLSYRNQWSEFSGNYITTDMYFDKNLGKYGGVGLCFLHDKAGSALTTDYVYLDYAYQVKIQESGILSFGVELGYIQKSLDWSKLTFGDMIDPRKGFVYPSVGIPFAENIKNIDLGSGIVFHNKHFFVSYAVHHINQPNLSLTLINSRLSMQHNLYLGGWLNLSEKVTLSPQLDLKMQNNFQNAVAWLKADYDFIQLGFGYRNKDAILYSIGIKNKSIRVFYCYDLTVSKLSNNSVLNGGSHEVSIQGTFGKESNVRAYKVF